MDDQNNPERSGYPSRESEQPGSGDPGMTQRMDNMPVQPPAYNPPPAPGYGAPPAPVYNPPPAPTQPLPPAYGAPPAPYTPPQYAPPPQYVPPQYTPAPANTGFGGTYANAPVRDVGVGMIIEIIGGLVGFMGIGHMLMGRVVPGLALLVGWWVAVALSWIVLIPLVVLTCGIGACLIPILWAAPPILSALWLRSVVTGRQMFNR